MLYAQFTFFHQSYDIMKDLEPQLREFASRLNEVFFLRYFSHFLAAQTSTKSSSRSLGSKGDITQGIFIII